MSIRNLLLSAAALLCMFHVRAAAQPTFEAKAPLLVATGENFQIEFNLDADPDSGTFVAPSFDGFELIAGPVTSYREQTFILNGSMEHTKINTFAYVLMATQKGNYTIGAAEVQSGGKTYRTQPVKIEVVDEAQSQTQQGGQQSQNNQTASIGKDDVFIRISVDKNSVFKGEPVTATLKLYRRIPLVGMDDVKLPSFNGFWTRDLNVENAPTQRETYNGRIYETNILSQYLLYPQQAGKLRIDPAEMTVIAQIVRPSRSRSFDPFFDMPDVTEARRKLTTAPIDITVKELPAGAPASFSGAVGKFTMENTPPTNTFTANSAATYTVKISGTGNLPFIQAPTLSLPSSFELYDVKTTESLKNAASGISGYRQFEYPFIARAEGSYTVPPIEFTYFDPQLVKYVTLATRELELDVQPDTSGGGLSGNTIIGGLSKEEVELLGQDIRFIKLGNAGLRPKSAVFVGSTAYWIVIVLLVALFAATSAYLHKRIKELQNTTLIRGKRANRIALQRFRTAAKYMSENNQHNFYEEMLQALWGYMSDKLNIPVANLTKENVREEMRKCGISPDAMQRFIDTIVACEEAQYSPMASAQMSEVYAEGVNIISELESTIKKHRSE